MKSIIHITLILAFASQALIAQTTFTKTQTITLATGGNMPPEGDAPYPIASADMDNDGFIDLVIGTDLGGAIFWYKNDGTGNFAVQPAVTTALPRVIDIVLADINGDTTIDIIATSFDDNKLVYYPNSIITPGTFGAEQVISSTLAGAGDIDLVNLNGDAFPDLVATAFGDNKVVWFANDASGNFGPENMINNTIVSPGSIDMKDIDADGDLDLVISSSVAFGTPNTSVVEVFYNNALVFTKDPNSVDTEKDYMFNIFFEDIDASNNTGITLDILATDLAENLSHYNKEASGACTETVLTTSIVNPASVEFCDLDTDGLKDIVLTSGTNGSGSDLVWYKNNGGGNFSSEIVIDATQNLTFKFTINDFDNDGDLDIATAAYTDDQVSIFNNQKIVLSVDDISVDNLSIYPNPAFDRLFIKSSNIETRKFKVHDMLGKTILRGAINTNASIDISNLKRGLYFLKIENSFTSLKFIKQ